MGKLKVYVREYTDFYTTHVSVPTSEVYKKHSVYEDLVDIAEEIGYDTISGESRKAAFIDTAMDVLKIKFRNPAEMKRFRARVCESYEP